MMDSGDLMKREERDAPIHGKQNQSKLGYETEPDKTNWIEQ